MLVLLACLGCQRSARQPNVLLITLDTVRADHLSAYGYERPTTPRLEALARAGVLCESAYAPMATTAPSHATMFTSLLPRSHGVVKNGYRLAAERKTLGEILREQGYRTAAIVSSFVVNRRFGLDQGFIEYDDVFSGDQVSMPTDQWEGQQVDGPFDRRATETTDRALGWLEREGDLGRSTRPDTPYFLWVHYFDPHSPYDPPPDHAGFLPPDGTDDLTKLIAAYDGEIRYVDSEFGRLIDALRSAGQLDDTLIVVAGDHGEGLMQHGHLEHGLHLYEEAVRVPLVFHWPAALSGGRRITAPVQLTDLLPTVVDLAGVPARDGAWQGVSLARVLEGAAKADPARPVWLQRRLYEGGLTAEGLPVKGEQYAVRSGRWKFFLADEEGRRELYDLEQDPEERTNLADSRPAETAVLARVLDGWLRLPAGAPPRQVVSEEDLKRLRSLGYVR